MILLDALYVKSFGGVNILKIIIQNLSLDQRKNTVLVIDKKVKLNYEDIIGFNKIKKVKSNLINKLFFYNIKKWDKIFSLGNFPSINVSNSEIFVYNMQYFLFDISMLKGRLKINWIIKKKLIELFFNLQYSSIIFQTEYMKNISSYSSIRVKKSYVFPIYKEFSKIDNFKTSRDFLYITSNQSYKNNLELIEAWRTSSISSILYLTIENPLFEEDENIIYLGQMPHYQIEEFVIENKPVIIQSSEIESFGITCVEASMWGLPLLALKRDYLDSVISNYSYFEDFQDLIQILNNIEKYKIKIPNIKAKNNPKGLVNLIWA